MHNRVQIGCSQSISECLSCLGSVIFAVIHPQKDQKSFLEERNRQLEDRLKLRRNDFKYLFAFEISSHQNTPLVHRVFAPKLKIYKAIVPVSTLLPIYHTGKFCFFFQRTGGHWEGFLENASRFYFFISGYEWGFSEN